ncbi:MAG: hypothetical protein C0501_19790 [Isosphaera sp.]|nr:hypothetical protein [Isosphaera sp.]
MAIETLPDLARRQGLSLDMVREFLRRRPDLAALAVRVGGARGFDPAAADRIVEEYRAARRRAPAAA